MKWWSNPKQRQRWHSSEILPSDTDDWGQIFFDLFFVGGAYNLGNVIKNSESLDTRTILYFMATGFPSIVMWHDKLYYDARFTTRPGRDVVHLIMEIFQFCCVGTALSRIRSVEVESHPCNHIDMFEFAMAVFLSSLLTIVRFVEVVFFVEGDPGAREVAKRVIFVKILPALFLLLATVESGRSSFGGGDHDEGCDAYEKPILYCISSWICRLVIDYFDKVLLSPKGRRKFIEEISVPMNVHFCMHRVGEWMLLMFGESIMSLVIVEGDNESLDHNIKFFAGILSVALLAKLHFKSEPGHNEDHALSRSRSSNYLYTTWLIPIYSLALIATGISYKMFLYNHGNYKSNRYLAEEDYAQMEEREQNTANLFSKSLTLVLICTDLNFLLHQGTRAFLDQIELIPKGRCFFLFLCNVFLLIFTAMSATIQNDPDNMALFGLAAILLKYALRRSFKSWKQIDTPTPNIDDDGILHRKGTAANKASAVLSSNILGTDSEDDNYQYEIEVYETVEATLAKFEIAEAQEFNPAQSPIIIPDSTAPPNTHPRNNNHSDYQIQLS
ncbi:hypothetical protein ACHAWF_006221 [Thalassiosira exigua]